MTQELEEAARLALILQIEETRQHNDLDEWEMQIYNNIFFSIRCATINRGLTDSEMLTYENQVRMALRDLEYVTGDLPFKRQDVYDIGYLFLQTRMVVDFTHVERASDFVEWGPTDLGHLLRMDLCEAIDPSGQSSIAAAQHAFSFYRDSFDDGVLRAVEQIAEKHKEVHYAFYEQVMDVGHKIRVLEHKK